MRISYRPVILGFLANQNTLGLKYFSMNRFFFFWTFTMWKSTRCHLSTKSCGRIMIRHVSCCKGGGKWNVTGLSAAHTSRCYRRVKRSAFPWRASHASLEELSEPESLLAWPCLLFPRMAPRGGCFHHFSQLFPSVYPAEDPSIWSSFQS